MCAVSIAYAVRYPERVSHLILYGGYAMGWKKRARSAAEKEEDDAMLTLMRVGWGKENPAFRQLFTSQFMPGATKEQADWFNELQRITVSGQVAARIYEAAGETDVTALLPQVRVPTLVLQRAMRPASRSKPGVHGGRHSGRPVRGPGGPQPPFPRDRAGLRPVPGADPDVPGQ